jgi:cobalt/nickel transport system permease protein
VLIGLLAAALVSGAVLAWFASPDLDGLEWSIAGVAGEPEAVGAGDSALHESLAGIQEGTALLPDYAFPAAGDAAAEAESGTPWPAVDAGTSTAGVIGAGIVLGFAALIGFMLRRRREQPMPEP